MVATAVPPELPRARPPAKGGSKGHSLVDGCEALVALLAGSVPDWEGRRGGQRGQRASLELRRRRRREANSQTEVRRREAARRVSRPSTCRRQPSPRPRAHLDRLVVDLARLRQEGRACRARFKKESAHPSTSELAGRPQRGGAPIVLSLKSENSSRTKRSTSDDLPTADSPAEGSEVGRGGGQSTALVSLLALRQGPAGRGQRPTRQRGCGGSEHAPSRTSFADWVAIGSKGRAEGEGTSGVIASRAWGWRGAAACRWSVDGVVVGGERGGGAAAGADTAERAGTAACVTCMPALVTGTASSLQHRSAIPAWPEHLPRCDARLCQLRAVVAA